MRVHHSLGKATKANVHNDPFPHILVENALDEDLLGALIETLPSPEVLAKGTPLGSNKHFSRGWEDEVVPQLWKEFLQLHITQEFYARVIELVGDGIKELHPNIEEKYGPLEELTVGKRGFETFKEGKDILLEAQMFVQTPVVGKPNSYRIGHVDDPSKLYNGLLYLRLPGDDSVGANLELLRYKGKKKKFHNKLRKLIDDRYVEVVKTIPYKANTFVLLPCSLYSLHGVQVRQKTKWPRYYMNTLGELPEPLFSLEPYWENSFDAVRRKLGI
ncbi:MAG: hypothetical protein WDZ75_01810 [Candidatus Paceibacterota bacterium]